MQRTKLAVSILAFFLSLAAAPEWTPTRTDNFIIAPEASTPPELWKVTSFGPIMEPSG